MWQGPEGDPQEFRAISSEQLAKKKKKVSGSHSLKELYSANNSVSLEKAPEPQKRS